MAKDRIGVVGPGRMGLMDKADMGSPLIGTVREPVKEGRKLKAENAVPDWTGLGTDLS